MKLNVGCGNRKIHGFVNIDLNPSCEPDVVASCGSIPSEYHYADLIYACHVLEHYPRMQIPDLLSHWYACLTSGGVLRIAVPDFESIFELYQQDPKSLKDLQGFLYGGQKTEYDYHHVAFNFYTLQALLNEAGFRGISRYDWRTTEHFYVDDYSQSYLPHMDKINGKLMSLNVEATKP